MAYSEQLAARVRKILADYDDVVEKRMFGGLIFMLHNHLCCGIIQDDLMLRVGAEQRAALQQPHIHEIVQAGRTMRNMILVEAAVISDDSALETWLQYGISFVSGLPTR